MHVLLVEDNTSVAETMMSALELRGITVQHTWSGSIALQLAGDEEHPFDVVISDYDLGPVKGTEVLDVWYEHDPDVVRILYSGIDRTSELVHMRHREGVRFYNKVDFAPLFAFLAGMTEAARA
jgi:DNA-binding NtrC family response regulator